MNNEEINELLDNMSFEEKDYMYTKIIESKLFDELRRKAASWLKIQHIPYKLIHTEQVPYTPLMRNFLYTFEFCRRRYVITDDLDFNIAGHYFDNDKFLFLLQHNFGIRIKHDAAWTPKSMKKLMLRIEAETKPEYREMLAIEMENFDKMRQELLKLFIFCNQQKKLRFDSNPAFTDIDFTEYLI